MAFPPVLKDLKFEGVASTHQADCKYGEFAGSQCLSNCVVYLASSYFNNETPLTTTEDLDLVLELGTRLDFILRKSGTLPSGIQTICSVTPCTELHTGAWLGMFHL
ncbi:tegument protein [Saguinine gammaherpesvirus 1]|uniref:Tegument protein n=1 Tax=Saguinine gammaherpesvirus 1 TaxID=2169901 RepID=A0A9Q8QWV4_9GAMA|nr:tegument protein [Saguinine gammaherpesvirus 1]